jgi:hypothetical protein
MVFFSAVTTVGNRTDRQIGPRSTQYMKSHIGSITFVQDFV